MRFSYKAKHWAVLKPFADMDDSLLAVASEVILEFSDGRLGDSRQSDSIETKASNAVVYKESWGGR